MWCPLLGYLTGIEYNKVESYFRLPPWSRSLTSTSGKWTRPIITDRRLQNPLTGIEYCECRKQYSAKSIYAFVVYSMQKQKQKHALTISWMEDRTKEFHWEVRESLADFYQLKYSRLNIDNDCRFWPIKKNSRPNFFFCIFIRYFLMCTISFKTLSIALF